MELEQIEVRAGVDGTIHVPSVRRAVRQMLGDVSIEFVRDALLLTSELTSNATMHAGGAECVSASFDRPAMLLRLTVFDHIATPPRLSSMRAAVGGFGLGLVDRIADRWGWTAEPCGKSVWFELSRPLAIA